MKADGRVVIYRPGHPNAQKSGHIYRARYVMSQHLGRPLEDNELVKHINGDLGDDRLSNLELVEVKIGSRVGRKSRVPKPPRRRPRRRRRKRRSYEHASN